MKISIISYWSCPLTKLGVLKAGGMNVYVLNLANNLSELGNSVDIYTHAHRENDERILQVHPNVRVIHLARTSKDYYQDINFYTQKILEFMSRNHLTYDIFHAHYYYSGLVGLKLKEKLSLPLIVTFHTLGLMKKIYAGVMDHKRIKAEKIIIGKADSIIASSELEGKDLSYGYKCCKDKIYIVPPGVNHHIFKVYNQQFCRKKLHLPQNLKIVLFIGRIDPIKGISLLIEAVSRLTYAYPSFKRKFRVLLIGGDINDRQFWQQPEVEKIKQLIKTKNLDCCVKFLGSRSYSLLPYYYNATDVLVMPSIYESFGLVVLEAMACGATVLASNAGGLTYLIKDKINGRLFRSGNTNNLSQVLWDLLNDRNQRINLGKQAFKSSQKFCWSKQARRIYNIYKKIQ